MFAGFIFGGFYIPRHSLFIYDAIYMEYILCVKYHKEKALNLFQILKINLAIWDKRRRS